MLKNEAAAANQTLCTEYSMVDHGTFLHYLTATPLADMQPRPTTEPPPCFTDGSAHCCVNVHLHRCKFQIEIHHSMRPMTCSCIVSYVSFSSRYPFFRAVCSQPPSVNSRSINLRVRCTDMIDMIHVCIRFPEIF